MVPHEQVASSLPILKIPKRVSKPKRKIFDDNEPRMKLPNEEDADAPETLIIGSTMVQSVQFDKSTKSLQQVQAANNSTIIQSDQSNGNGLQIISDNDLSPELNQSRKVSTPGKSQTEPSKDATAPEVKQEETPGKTKRSSEEYEVIEEIKLEGSSPIDKTKRSQPIRIQSSNNDDTPTKKIQYPESPEQIEVSSPKDSELSNGDDSLFLNTAKLNGEDTDFITSPIATKMNPKAPVSPESRKLIQKKSKEDMAQTEKESCKTCNMF